MNESPIELHRQRAANLMSMMLLLELGVGLCVDAPVEQPVVALPAKDGTA